MKISWWVQVALLAAPLLLASSSAEASEARLFPYPYQTHKLDNGLTVILVPMRSDNLVAYWTLVRTGSRDEYEPGHSGFAHFFEHMMFRGTERFPGSVYNAKMTEMGADGNASTWDDYTMYYSGITTADLPTVIDLESDRFQNLSYPEDAFKTESGAVYGEYRKGRTSPFAVLGEAIRAKAFTTHTYGHTTIGYERDIAAMPTMFEYSKSFFARYYRPENCVVLVVGDFDPAATLVLLRQKYGPWKPGYVPPRIPVEPEQAEERRVEVSFPGQTLPILWLSYKEDRYDPTSRGMAALALLGELAFGETSELYRKLVLEDQTVDFIAGDSSGGRDPGLFDITTQVYDAAKIPEVQAAIEATIAKLQTETLDPQRLAEIKSRSKYGFLMNLDTPTRVARSVSRVLAMTGGMEALETQFATLDAVTPEDLRDAARRFLQPQRRTVGILLGERPQ